MNTHELVFRDRVHGGEALAERLRREKLPQPCIVLALPRGGLPPALVVARRLQLPLDILTVRKVGAPGNPEYAVGAVADDVVYRDTDAPPGACAEDAFRARAAEAQAEMRRRDERYRRHLAPLGYRGHAVLLVDDGIATGDTMIAAIQAVRRHGATHVVVATPVASREAVKRLRAFADQVIALSVPLSFESVGQWYELFDQVTDEEAEMLLEAAARLARPRVTPPTTLKRSAV